LEVEILSTGVPTFLNNVINKVVLKGTLFLAYLIKMVVNQLIFELINASVIYLAEIYVFTIELGAIRLSDKLFLKTILNYAYVI
jgi:hypothetical protein